MDHRVTFAAADIAVIVVYFVAMLAVGLSFRRREKTSEGYYLAGRTLTLPAFVATLVSTWYGGILGVGEYTHTFGLSNWVVFGLPYYVFALVFALWLAPKIRAAQLYTIPDKLAEAHGKPAGFVGALFCYGMTNPAPYVLMLGVMLELIFRIPLFWAMIVGLVLSTVYVYTGGFRADVRVNVVQFVLMFLGFALVLPFCGLELGGFGWLRDTLVAQGAALHLTWHGGNSPLYILAWFFIALWTMVDPGFHQRCYAAESSRTAQRGVLVSIGFWFVFDLMTTTAGLYARAALPDIDPLMAYPLLAELLLPPLAKGIFFTGMLATIMSTLVSFTFLCGVTFSRDVVWRAVGGDEDAGVAKWTGIGLLLTSVLALLLVHYFKSVVDLWYLSGSVFIPGLLLPLLTAYGSRRRYARWPMVAGMVLGSGLSLGWLVWGQTHLVDGWAVYPFGIEPLYPGLLVSAVCTGLARLLGERQG